ncbi:MAG: RagB/SusD family nutrient uptake outer membrane protein [Prevotellaceae bacterium]|jgi:tetratricopeptide (TPR) repeat protein|nr:RagB/SusD family nutrient uptake outer membrane protein [Prevotellaceae bacterium]
MKNTDMKNTVKILIISILLSATFTSCLNDLNTEPLEGGTSLTAEKAWQKPEIYHQMLAKIYAGFSLSGNVGPSSMPDIVGIGDEGETSFIRSWWNLQELTTDEALCAWANNGIAELNFNTWTSSNRFVQFAYNRMYMTVAYCNEYLRNTTDEKLSKRDVGSDILENIPQYRAEVTALRALNYYYLMDLYANIPLIDENMKIGDLPEQKNREFMFSYIENQLKSVENLLPEKSEINYGRVNNYVVYTVLAKLYLNAEVYINQNKYTDAIDYLKKIIDSGKYELTPIYTEIFGADNNLSTEMIFPVIFDGMNSTCYGGTKYLISAAYDNDMAPQFGIDEGWSGIRALENLVDKFSANDARALFWKEKRTKETYSWSDFNSGYSVVKYTNLKNNGDNGSHVIFPDTDFPMFRLTDVYLMYAEAVLRGGAGGDLATALDYVNDIQDKRGLAPISNAKLTLDFLLDERCRELYWEGHRRTDLIRFGKFTKDYKWNWKNGVFVGTANINDYCKIFPLPVQELAANKNLKQNTGY